MDINNQPPPQIQPIVPPPVNRSKIPLLIVLEIIIVVGSFFAGIQVGKGYTSDQQSVVTQPTTLPGQVAVNPTKQLSLSRNAKRKSDITAIAGAVKRYVAEQNGQVPSGLTNNPTEIGTQGVDLCPVLISVYLAAFPVDPLINKGVSVTDCSTFYNSGYMISGDNSGQITVTAPKAELDSVISVTE